MTISHLRRTMDMKVSSLFLRLNLSRTGLGSLSVSRMGAIPGW